jgi:hypothetical protein
MFRAAYALQHELHIKGLLPKIKLQLHERVISGHAAVISRQISALQCAHMRVWSFDISIISHQRRYAPITFRQCEPHADADESATVKDASGSAGTAAPPDIRQR